MWEIIALLTPLLLTLAGSPPAPAAPDTPTASDVTASAGVIEGVLRVQEPRRRRTVDRYGGATGARDVQSISPVVYLKGPVGSAADGPGPATMAQEDTAFVPGLLVIPVGTTVRFPNQDPFFHNVFSYSTAARFDLGRYPRGESKEVRFDQPGVVKVYCEVHEPMRAAIVVVENPFWAQPGADGEFRIAGVPAGTYTLVAWHVDRGEEEREVRVPADGVVRVEIEL